MVSYDEAVAIVQDPQADPVMLAKVAYENPEFGANVAAHPRAYPGLKRWIAQFGDERARRMVAQTPASFEPQGYSGVKMLDEQFNSLPDESVLPSFVTSADVQAMAHDAAQSSPQAYEPQQPAEQSYDPAQQQAATGAQTQPAAANAYGFTAQQAATANDPAVMQQIAQYAPELHVALAGNPYLYPELRAWLGMLGNPAVNEVLSHRQ
ncbi:hypothetical protein [Bifidobacterium pseudolongum]|uniref:variant leucine-rich repeat-containing protein n=1 Tax=Bifidobacterium pseudolongum TaxID=1694 RepID=UPI00101F168D|nr:hypothetical protein [Bifidobacterium pseudolongum]RYQ67482.1 hypothetical protein PG2103B_1389 [Bifidobacterium pseudolongum subsp. globosum]